MSWFTWTTIAEPIPDRVAKGAALLDRLAPGWARKVWGRPVLIMDNSCKCVLGQLYGDYWDAVGRVLGVEDVTDAETPASYGFTLADHEEVVGPAWDELAACWEREIAKRLEVAV